MDEDSERLLRFLEHDLPEPEAERLRERLAAEPELRAQVDRLRALRRALQAGKPDAFAPYFSERVVRRLMPAEMNRTAEGLYDALRWVFTRTAVAGLVLAGTLGAYNVLNYRALGVAASLVEALFGLPSATLADALAYGEM